MFDESRLLAWVSWGTTGCPSPIAVNAKDGSILLYVPAGEFEMGSHSGPFEKEKPVHRVYLDAYCIGAYAVTNEQYARFLSGSKPADSDVSQWILLDSGCFVRRAGGRYEAYGGKESHPVVQVSWYGASAYAQWSGLSLPTEAQWERAARGPLGLEYPWGKDWDASRCRHGKNRGSERTAAVYGYPGGVSGEGAYNPSGNVWEWCADWYDDGYYEKSPRVKPLGPDGGSRRVIRGGGWCIDDPSHFRAASRGWDVPGGRGHFSGFRLVSQLAS